VTPDEEAAAGVNLALALMVGQSPADDEAKRRLVAQAPTATTLAEAALMGTDRSEVVRAGYDAIASRYLTWSAEIDRDPRLRFLGELERRLDDGSTVVDLGCGVGLPCTAMLAERHSVLGVDISDVQIRLARERVPTARFERHDLATFDLPEQSHDAVTAFYSLTHLPRDQHLALLTRFQRWLRPGGLLLATFSAGESDGVQDDFLGVPMFFSGFDADTNRRLVSDAGFTIILDEVVTMQEPEGPATFLWIMAQARPSG
jgi:ubiquinone/menaquinone biosynthesis C-methylase UbiE